MHSPDIDAYEFDTVTSELRRFFRNRGYIEAAVQHRLSILAACEDPKTIGIFSYAGQAWPLPQTGQMWLEYEQLRHPDAPGFYCVSYSYRNEPSPIPGRHDLTFPMFEFEMRGDVNTLIEMQHDLLHNLGFSSDFVEMPYLIAAEQYGVTELMAEHEQKLWEDVGPVVFLLGFPEFTSPFWNMRRNADGTSAKVDAILYGIETIGSAERSTDPEEMLRAFLTISGGDYAGLLFSHFGKERVMAELNRFLSLEFFERCGGGIGVTRMIRAMKLAKLL